ncbi:MAG TPA: formylglycine-generating enzyme family protein, partial [bacterium]|nr:formylglycine-generating enzyme family protein [bacterium]
MVCSSRWLVVLGLVMMLLAYLVPCVCQAGAPVVTNVVAYQRTTGGKEVVVTYDLHDPDSDPCTVTLDFVLPTGEVIRPQLLTGQYGVGIASGTGKQIVWDAMREQPGRYNENCRARVTADDGQGETNEMVYYLPNSQEPVALVRVPAGDFAMGSTVYTDEQPVHTVYLDEYWIMKYPLTVGQWRVYAQANGLAMPSEPGWGGSYTGYMTDTNFNKYPIVNVSWNDVQAFALWSGLKLPTEAQWEKAARGTDSRRYPWGAEEPDSGGLYRANLSGSGDGYAYTSPVGTYGLGVSPYGAYDMAGNVWEWCADWYSATYYSQTPPGGWVNPLGPTSGSYRVLRGGSWNNDAGSARCSARYNGTPTVRDDY